MNPNRHPDRAFWARYAAGALTFAEREPAERHLYVCEECLAVYIRCVDESEPGFIPSFDGLEDAVMTEIRGLRASPGESHGAASIPNGLSPAASPAAAIPGRAVASNPYAASDPAAAPRAVLVPAAAPAQPAERRWRSHPLFLYAVAACITFLLMSTGAFERLMEQTDEWRNARMDGQQASLSDRWTEQAVDALAVLQTKIKEGSRHEPY